MIGFLTPAALFGLALLSIPIILHIFKPRKVRQTPFSSLRWLRASQHRISRRIRLHQILLFLLRAGFVTLVVLALAKPIFSSKANSGAADRLVIVDVSRSMGYQTADGKTPLDAARQVAEQLATNVLGGDRTTVILASNKSRALGPLVGDASPYVRGLRAAQTDLCDTDLSAALPLVRPLLGADRKNERVELYFLTDNYVNNWRQGPINKFVNEAAKEDLKVQVNVVEVRTPAAQNAWVADARRIDITNPAKRRIVRVELGAAGPESLRRTIRLTGIDGVPDRAESVTLQPGQPLRVDFDVPSEIDLKGKVAKITLNPSDALANDDTYWLNLDATAATRVLIVEPETTQVEENQPGFHLRTALEALNSMAPGSLNVIRRKPTDILTSDLAETEIVILVDVPKLDDGNLAALQDHVKNGGGMLVFLGNDIDLPFYNTRLRNPTRPTDTLSPAELKERANSQLTEKGLAPLSRVQWQHPLFARLSDPIYGDIEQVRFRTYHQMEVDPHQTGVEVLARIGDGPPAVVERLLGGGKVLFFNTTANDEWTDLPRKKSFLPLLDRAIKYLGRGPMRGSFIAGEPVNIPLRLLPENTPATLILPDGKSQPAAVRRVSGQAILRLEEPPQLGIYTVDYTTPTGRVSFPFVVNAGPEDSRLEPVEVESLRGWWGQVPVQVFKPDRVTGQVDLQQTRLMLDIWLLAAACCLLAAEFFFVHWLCPNVNPTVVTHSIVQQQGFLAPSAEEPEPESSPVLQKTR